MNIIHKIKEELGRYSGIRIRETENSIEAIPEAEKTFTVSLYLDHKSLTVGYDGWQEHFVDEEEAFRCFLFGLTGDCRLRVDTRGDRDCKWTLEYLNDGDWVKDSVHGILLYPFWRIKTTRNLVNQLKHIEE